MALETGAEVLLPLVLFVYSSNTLASVELGAKCSRAGQSETLAGEWHAAGRPRARVALIFRPRLGSSLSFTRMHRHFLLRDRICFNPVQQSMVGAFASPPTYGRHVASPTSWSAHSSLSLARSELAKQTNINSTKKKYDSPFAFLDDIAERERERGRRKRGSGAGVGIRSFGFYAFSFKKDGLKGAGKGVWGWWN